MILLAMRRWVAGRLGALALSATLALGLGVLHAGHLEHRPAAAHDTRHHGSHDHHTPADHHTEATTPSCCFLPTIAAQRAAYATRATQTRPPVGRAIRAAEPAPPSPPPRSV
jgi:hypothetical protein